AVLGQTTDQTSDDQHLVLLGEDVSVSDIARFDPTQLVAIVCLQGSALSHSAVLARALGIPAVVATGPIDHIKNEDAVIVDGDLGIVVLSPSQSTQSAYATIVEAARSFDESLLADKDLPAVTKDGFRVQLFANTGLLADVSPGIKRGAEGIGLYRSEIPFLAHEAFPTESEQYQVYHTILTAYHPRPVTMRTLDIGSDKQLPYMNIKENNPALGWRGIRFSLDNRAVLVTQLRAMLKADIGLGNLQIMLPMITSNAETREVAAVLDSVVTRLQAEGEPVTRPDLGIMVEVPGVIPLLRGQKEWIDFISIGTNDLTQYLLAVDRTNPRVSTLYDHLHPAMIQTMADLAKTAETLQLRVSVCGEMAADPYAAVLLIGMRFPALSMNAFSIPRIKALTRGLTVEEAQICLTDVLTMDDPQDIRQRVHATLVDAGLDHLIYRGASPEPSEVGSG
ncbi:MAG: phosphoenolpyruvate--protein phosphotransferase, partial [Proteobacteria bacterium]|nr:phosphoenolpyruvate--protein phosphotransferase [Pseudomonadota bacterium]